MNVLSRLALPAALLLLAAGAPPEPGKPPITAQTARSGGPVDPLQAALRFDRAELSFEVFPDRQAIAGSAKLAFTARRELEQLLLDLDTNLVVQSIAIDGRRRPRGSWSNRDGRLYIRLPHELAEDGQVVVTIDYAGTPHVALRAPWDDGIVWSSVGGKPWIATTTEGYGCDLLWPCLDFPTGEPAEVTLAITVPAGLSAPSNGKLERIETLADGRTTWHWRARRPNTYAVALNIGPYQEIKGVYRSRFGNSVPLHLWHLPGKEKQARGLFAEFKPTLDFFETMIGPYPFGDEKMGVVETPYLGMEHQTINAYGFGYAKTADGFDWLFQHELAHEWFGNQATAADWDDYWLHEGYAQYMQPLYGRWREGEARYAKMMADQRVQIINKAPVIMGKSRTEEQVYETDNGGPGADIYYKGSWVLHTLRWLIGDQAFWDVTRRMVYGRPDPEPGNFEPRYTSTREFVALVEEVTGENYGWFFDVYLRQAKLPALIGGIEDGELRMRWRVPGGGDFPMPIEVQIGDKLKKLAMEGGEGSIAVPAGAHVVVDPHARVLRASKQVEEFQAWQAGRK